MQKVARPRPSGTSKTSRKTKAQFLTKGVVDMSTKFDQLLSTNDRESHATFESTDDDNNDDDSTSSDDFFVTSKKAKNERGRSNKAPAKRDIERIIHSKSLSKLDNNDDDEDTDDDARSNDVTAAVVQSRPEGVVYEDKNVVFTESDSDDDDDSDSEDESNELKVKQGIKNQILKNCFASLAARHT